MKKAIKIVGLVGLGLSVLPLYALYREWRDNPPLNTHYTFPEFLRDVIIG